MKPIVTLTLNPSLDTSSFADKIRPLHKIRTTEERYHAGGGGINVARVVLELGGAAHAVYLAGGPTGKVLEDLLALAGVQADRVPIGGYTRISHTVFEVSSEQEFRFVPEGPQIELVEWEKCLVALSSLDFDYIIASGSLPRGLPNEAYHRVIEIAAQKGARVVLDTSGPVLRATLAKGVFLIKPSLGELEALVDSPLPDLRAQTNAARGLVDAGQAEIVAVTSGGDGALIVNSDDAWHIAAPPVLARSAVGAGDSFLAALTMGLVQGRSLKSSLAYGVSAGTAAVLSPGAELCQAADVERLYAQLNAT